MIQCVAPKNTFNIFLISHVNEGRGEQKAQPLFTTNITLLLPVFWSHMGSSHTYVTNERRLSQLNKHTKFFGCRNENRFFASLRSLSEMVQANK